MTEKRTEIKTRHFRCSVFCELNTARRLKRAPVRNLRTLHFGRPAVIQLHLRHHGEAGITEERREAYQNVSAQARKCW